jgi:hypothetical protein
MVGLRGYKLNPALQRYLAAGPPVQEARGRPCQRRPDRIAKRLPAESIQTLVAEYVAGAPAAELGRRYGLAKTTVISVLRAADVRVRHARLSAADIARIVELHGKGLRKPRLLSGWAAALVPFGMSWSELAWWVGAFAFACH